jgi:hypothetical protein
MKRNEYKILKRGIPDVHLHSVTGSYWFDNQNNIVPWSENTGYLPTGYTPYSGYVVNNVTGSLPTGSYIWNGTSWSGLTGSLNQSYNLPIFLEASADEMGVMSSFDGNIEQVEQLCNFTYKQSGSVVTVYNSVNPDKLRKLIDPEVTYTIDWGYPLTGQTITSLIGTNSGTLYSNLPTASFNYSGYTGSYKLSLYLNSPWSNQKIVKQITVPNTGSVVVNPLGTSTGFTIPGNVNYTGSVYQNYLNDLDYTNNTGTATLRYMAIGGSKIGELKRYGETTLSSSMYVTGTYIPVGATTGSPYTGYTLEKSAIVSGSLIVTGIPTGSLWYMDFADGYTMITGQTSNFTKEEVINNVITRNEHFLGFIDDPTVYSDIFVERGRQGVMEPNLRLGEIDNMSELEIYGNGYFNIKKQ